MAEPAHNLYDDEQTPEPGFRPKLRLIQGGLSTAGKELSDSELEEAEEEADDSQAAGIDRSESTLFNDSSDQVGSGYNSNDQGSRRSKLIAAARGLATRRNIVSGGVIASIVTIVIGGMFGFASMELINTRENMLGGGNSLINKALQNRRAKAFSRQMRKLQRGSGLSKLNADKTFNKLVAAGFDVKRGASGNIDHLSYKGRVFDFNEPDLRKATKDFFGKGELGAEISRQFDAVSGARAATWRGKAARRLYGNMKIRFNNWLDRTPSDKADTDDKKFADNLRHADDGADQGSTGRSSVRSQDELKDGDGDGKVDTETADLSEDLDGANEYRNKALADPGLSDEDLLPGSSSRITNSLAEEGIDALLKGAPEIAEAVMKKTPGIAIKSFNALDYFARACRVRGTIRYIGNVQNVLFAFELSRFTLRFLTAPDHQKAGLLQSNGSLLLMKYLHTPNPSTGKVYSQAGGFQNVIMGNKSAVPSKINLAKMSTGRQGGGILSTIGSLLDKIPGINTPGQCRFYNNGVVQAGGLAVGLAVMLIPGVNAVNYGRLATQAAASLGLAVLEEVAWQVGTVQLVKAGARMAFNGMEKDGELVGDGISSGWGVLKGQSGGSNSLKPITKAQAVVLREQAQQDRQYALANQSIFERYFDIRNSESLATTLAFSMPRLNLQTPSALWRQTISAFSFESIGNLFGGWLPGTQRVLAAENECQNDEQIRDLDIEADVFCNPETAFDPDLDTDRTEEVLRSHRMKIKTKVAGKCVDKEVAAPFINSDGQPIDYPKGNPDCDHPDEIRMQMDMKDFVDHCHTGRTGILYTPITAENEDAFKQGAVPEKDNTCVENGSNLPGDDIGRYQRFTDWYGYLVDEENLVEDINEEYDESVSQTGTTAAQGAGVAQPGDLDEPSDNIACASGTRDVGVHTGYKNGSAYNIRLCAIPGVYSSSSESQPGTEFYIEGASGDTLVNSRISANVLLLAAVAKTSGTPLSVQSSYRTMQHQRNLCNANAGCASGGDYSSVARPGYSNHQAGLALDFNLGSGYPLKTSAYATANGQKASPNNPNVAPGSQVWQWLTGNASRFNMEQYWKEPWHWSPSGN